jgi:hypothetical protein
VELAMNEWGLAAPDPTYGTGASLQGTCPAFPPPPDGYAAWNTNVNGSVPANVVARAKALANDMSKALGYTETIYSGGVPLLLRVDAHTWSTDASGNPIAGCFHGVDVWVPTPGSTPPAVSTSSSSSPNSTLWALSLGLGVIVSGVTIFEYLRRKR